MSATRLRLAPRRIVDCFVRDPRCPRLDCFIPTREHHRSAAGMSGVSSWTGESYCCLTREQRGCPGQTSEARPRRYQKHGAAWAALQGREEESKP